MTPMPMMTWSVLLLGVCTCLIVNVSSQTMLRSSLQSTNQTYVCPDEIVTYVCSGVGDVINLYAPPHVPSDFPLSYMRGFDTPGTEYVLGPIKTNLTSTILPLMEADLFVLNSSLAEFFIICSVSSENAEAQQHRPSGPPLDVTSPVIGLFRPEDYNTASVEVSWAHNNGNYDPSYYTVQLFENNTETEYITISAESNSLVAIFSVSFNAVVDVHARIIVTSKCNETTKGILTRTIRIPETTIPETAIPETTIPIPEIAVPETASKSKKTAYVFWVILSAAAVVL